MTSGKRVSTVRGVAYHFDVADRSRRIEESKNLPLPSSLQERKDSRKILIRYCKLSYGNWRNDGGRDCFTKSKRTRKPRCAKIASIICPRKEREKVCVCVCICMCVRTAWRVKVKTKKRERERERERNRWFQERRVKQKKQRKGKNEKHAQQHLRIYHYTWLYVNICALV